MTVRLPLESKATFCLPQEQAKSACAFASSKDTGEKNGEIRCTIQGKERADGEEPEARSGTVKHASSAAAITLRQEHDPWVEHKRIDRPMD